MTSVKMSGNDDPCATCRRKTPRVSCGAPFRLRVRAVLLVVLCSLASVECQAPQWICNSQASSPSRGDSPYFLAILYNNNVARVYRQGQPLEIIIRSYPLEKFRRFFLQAWATNNPGTSVGSFRDLQGDRARTWGCQGGQGAAILTHRDSQPAALYELVRVNWVPPPQSLGPIKFILSVFDEPSRTWDRKESFYLRPAGYSGGPLPPATRVPPPFTPFPPNFTPVPPATLFPPFTQFPQTQFPPFTQVPPTQFPPFTRLPPTQFPPFTRLPPTQFPPFTRLPPTRFPPAPVPTPVVPNPLEPQIGPVVPRQCRADTYGRDFLVAFVEGSAAGSTLTLYATTRAGQQVSVTATAGGLPVGSYSLSSSSVISIRIPADARLSGTQRARKAVRVTATGDIALFTFQADQRACAAGIVFPVDALGTDYLTISWWPSINSPANNSFLVVAAANDNTQVTLTFPHGRGIRVTYNGVTYGNLNLGPLRVSLNRDDVLQLQDARLADLTSTRVSATAPIAVFSGNRHVSLGFGTERDFVFTQVPPTSSYGTNFVLPYLPQVRASSVKVVSKDDGNRVTISGVVTDYLLESGAYQQWSLPEGRLITLTSSSPVLVTFWVQGGLGGSATGGAPPVGYPALMLVPPLEQYLNNVYFAAPQVSSSQYVMTVVEQRYSSGVLLDGTPLGISGWMPVPGTELVGVTRSISSGSHRIQHPDPNARFSAFFYGYTNARAACGFAYSTGMCLGQIGGTFPPTPLPTSPPFPSPSPVFPTPSPTVSTEGSFFLYAAVAVAGTSRPQRLHFTTSQRNPAFVTVTAPATNRQLANRQVSTGIPLTVSIPADLVVQRNGKVPNVIRVQTQSPRIQTINAFAEVSSLGCGFTVLHPVKALGTEYYAMTWQPEARSDPDGAAVIAVVANTAGTTVRLTFSSPAVRVLLDGVQYTSQRELSVTLGQFDVLRLRDSNNADLSRTRITATQPVAVFSGNAYTQIGLSPNRDALIEQIPPVNTLGTIHILPAIPTATMKIKVVAVAFPTVVIITGQPARTLSASTPYRVFDVPPTQHVTVTTTNPSLVAYFVSSSVQGYPSMAVVPPVEQYLSSYSFPTPNVVGSTSYILLAIGSQYTNGLYLDNQLVPTSGWTSVPGSPSYVAKYIALPPGAHRVWHVNGAKFGASLYGYSPSSRCAYATPVGQGLRNLGQITPTPTVYPPTQTPVTGPITPLPPRRCIRTSYGREFVLAYMPGEGVAEGLEVYMASVNEQVLPVTITGATWRSSTVQVFGPQHQSVIAPASVRIPRTGKFNLALRVSSSTPGDLAVMGVHKYFQSCGASLVFPVSALGTRYYTATWWPADITPFKNAQIMAVATQDRTVVTFSFPLRRGINVTYEGRVYSSTRPLVLTINRDDVILLQDNNAADMTGIYIESTAPIAVFAGNTYTSVITRNNPEMLVEQMPPVETYGMRFFIPPTPGRRSGISKMKILARDQNTKVKFYSISSIRQVEFGAGEYGTYDIPADQHIYVEADKPILVIKFVGSTDRVSVGKPSMAVIPPVEQFLTDYVFVVPNINGGLAYATVVIKQQFVRGLLLDGAQVPTSGWQAVLGTGTETYVGQSLQVSPGRHRLTHTSGNDANTAFGVFIYGYSQSSCGYAFAGGMCLDLLSTSPPTILPPTGSTRMGDFTTGTGGPTPNPAFSTPTIDPERFTTLSTRRTLGPFSTQTQPQFSTLSTRATTRFSRPGGSTTRIPPDGSTTTRRSGTTRPTGPDGRTTRRPTQRPVPGSTEGPTRGPVFTTRRPASETTRRDLTPPRTVPQTTSPRVRPATTRPAITPSIPTGEFTTASTLFRDTTRPLRITSRPTLNPTFTPSPAGTSRPTGKATTRQTTRASTSSPTSKATSRPTRGPTTRSRTPAPPVTTRRPTLGPRSSTLQSTSRPIPETTSPIRTTATPYPIITSPSPRITTRAPTRGPTSRPAVTFSTPTAYFTSVTTRATSNPTTRPTTRLYTIPRRTTTAIPRSTTAPVRTTSQSRTTSFVAPTSSPTVQQTTRGLRGKTTLGPIIRASTTLGPGGLTTRGPTGGTTIPGGGGVQVGRDTYGRNFFFNLFDNPSNMVITTYSTSPVTYTVQSTQVNPPIFLTGTVSRSNPVTIAIPATNPSQGTGVSSSGVRITTSDEVSVSVLNQGTCAMYKAIPADALGVEYYVTTGQPVLADQSSNVGIRATEDGTSLSVTFPPNRGVDFFYNGARYGGGSTIQATLNKDQSFYIKDRNDLSGLWIKATKPVAVFAGNDRLSLGSPDASDAVVTQFAATDTWGKRFVLPAIPNDQVGGTIKALALQDQTRIKVKGNVGTNKPITEVNYLVSSARSGAVFDYQVVAGASLAIEADKPIQVVYYANGDSNTGTGNRPVSLLLPPVEQFMNLYTFSKPAPTSGNSNQFSEYVMVAVEKGKENGLILDGRSLATSGWVDLVTPWSSPAMVVNTLSVSDGPHTLWHQDPNVQFGTSVYGTSTTGCAYAYPAGMLQKRLGGGAVGTTRGPGSQTTRPFSPTIGRTTGPGRATTTFFGGFSTSRLPPGGSTTFGPGLTSFGPRSTTFGPGLTSFGPRFTTFGPGFTTRGGTGFTGTPTTPPNIERATTFGPRTTLGPQGTDGTTFVPSAGVDSRGRNFYLVFPANPPNTEDISLGLSTLDPAPASTRVSPQGIATSRIPEQTPTVGRSQGSEIALSKDLRIEGTGVNSRGVRLTSDREISVAAINEGCAVYLALPIDAYGTEYYGLTWAPSTAPPRPSEQSLILITATQDNTVVQTSLLREPTSSTNGRFVLNREQTLQIIVNGADLSGMKITADKPIGVVSGNSKVIISNGEDTGDLLMQLAPVSTWGRQFYFTAFPNDNVGGFIKMVASEAGTTVRLYYQQPGDLTKEIFWTSSRAGDFKLQSIPARSSFSITSSRPIEAVYFTSSEPGSNSIGRPSGLLLPAREQYLESYSFRSRDSSYTEFVTVMVEEQYISGIRLDDRPVDQFGWVTIPSRDGKVWKGKSFPVQAGRAHTLRHTTAGVSFGANVYGYRQGSCAYSYPAGLKLTGAGGTTGFTRGLTSGLPFSTVGPTGDGRTTFLPGSTRVFPGGTTTYGPAASSGFPGQTTFVPQTGVTGLTTRRGTGGGGLTSFGPAVTSGGITPGRTGGVTTFLPGTSRITRDRPGGVTTFLPRTSFGPAVSSTGGFPGATTLFPGRSTVPPAGGGTTTGFRRTTLGGAVSTLFTRGFTIFSTAVNQFANAPNPAQQYSCTTRDGTFYDPFSCPNFYVCENGVASRGTCPVGLHYSRFTTTCQEQRVAGCLLRPSSLLDVDGNNNKYKSRFVLTFPWASPNKNIQVRLTSLVDNRQVMVDILDANGNILHDAVRNVALKDVALDARGWVDIELPARLRLDRASTQTSQRAVLVRATGPITISD